MRSAMSSVLHFIKIYYTSECFCCICSIYGNLTSVNQKNLLHLFQGRMDTNQKTSLILHWFVPTLSKLFSFVFGCVKFCMYCQNGTILDYESKEREL